MKAILHLAQAVEVAAEPEDGWLRVTVVDSNERGFVKAMLAPSSSTGGVELPSLRAPATAAREALVAAAVAEWKRFRFGQGKETVEPFSQFVGQMWRSIGLPHDGRDTDLPWSAAAVSFMVRTAAADAPKYDGFKFAPSHSRYIHDAIKRTGVPEAPFWGFRLFEHRPQVGDLVARSREGPVTFELASIEDAFKSHTDIVVSVRPDEVLAIGGNVSNSVNVTRYAKVPSGHLSDGKGVFAHLVNNADT